MDIKGMRALSVDDNRNNLIVLEVFLKRMELAVDSFIQPKKGIAAAKSNDYDLVVVDYMMPGMNGIEFIRQFREFDHNTPIVLVTASGEKEKIQIDALAAGATDFISKPINFAVFSGRTKNLLKLKKAQLRMEDQAAYLTNEVEKSTRKVMEREHETLRVLGRNAEYKDPVTGAHISRVANYTKVIANAYGVPKPMQEIFYFAAPLHDIGKVGISDSIMLKPGKLNEDEWTIMKTHATIGYEILKNSKSEYLRSGGIIAFTHHEKYDGTGYPKGLKGSAIPIAGRIVALADTFDALTTKRPYKEAWSFNEGVEYVKNERGKHFDPAIVDAFFSCIDEIKTVYNDFKDSDEVNE